MFINIRFFLSMAIIIVVAYISSSILFLLLPNKGVEYEFKYSVNSKNIKSINLENIFLDKTQGYLANTKAKRFLKSVKLLAIYDLGKRGYIVIQESSSSKTHIIGKNELFKGYKLVEVSNKDALFEKNNKKYKLSLKIKNNRI